jgi:hypothetical protein
MFVWTEKCGGREKCLSVRLITTGKDTKLQVYGGGHLVEKVASQLVYTLHYPVILSRAVLKPLLAALNMKGIRARTVCRSEVTYVDFVITTESHMSISMSTKPMYPSSRDYKRTLY